MRFLSNLIASALGTLLALGLAVLLLFIVIFTIATSADQPPSVADASVLVVELAGPIPETAADDPIARAFGIAPPYDLRELKQSLEKAAVDERIAGVWLQFKGLQAQWATLEEIRQALVAFQAMTDKPLIASGDDYAMNEGAYFVATAADGIYASPEAFFAFNGFTIIQPFFAETLDMLHIDPQVVRAGKYKSAVEPFLRQNLSPANEEQLTALLQSINERFMTTVAEARDLPVDALQHLASEAALLTADDAYRAGLLDGLRYRDEVATLFRERLDAYAAHEGLKKISLAAYARAPRAAASLDVDAAGTVAIVYAEGAIVSGTGEANPFSRDDWLAAEPFVETMRAVRRDEGLDAVVIRINSPGGSASASDAIWRAIQLTAEEKPVIISMGDVAASGGYWIATAGDAIVANPLTITGSIGVFGVLFDASGFFNDKLGITFDGVRTSPYADLFSAVRPLSPAEVRLLESAIADTYQTFLEKVAASREELTVEEVAAIAQGRIWTGEDALDVGLVDALGGLEDAIERAAAAANLKAYDTTVYPRAEPFFVRFAEAFATQARRAWAGWTTSPAERLLLEQRRTLHRLARTHGTVQARMPFDLTLE